MSHSSIARLPSPVYAMSGSSPCWPPSGPRSGWSTPSRASCCAPSQTPSSTAGRPRAPEVALANGLHLIVGKCAIVKFSRCDLSVVRELLTRAPCALKLVVVGSAVYLGIPIGREASAAFCSRAFAKYEEHASRLRASLGRLPGMCFVCSEQLATVCFPRAHVQSSRVGDVRIAPGGADACDHPLSALDFVVGRRAVAVRSGGAS